MSKKDLAAAAAFAGAPSADRDMGKDSVVIHVSYGKDQDEEFLLNRGVYGILKSGMTSAEKVAAYWKTNAKAIGAAFWDLTKFEGEARAVVLRELRGIRGKDSGKPYSRLFASLTQSTSAWNRHEKAKLAQSNHPKGSAEYDDQVKLANGYAEDARNLAGQQCRAILGHLADQLSGNDKESGSREQKGASQLIEETITDWNALVLGMRGTFALPAERVLLSDAINALRSVLTEYRAKNNLQSLIARKPQEDDDDDGGDPVNPLPAVKAMPNDKPKAEKAKVAA